MTVVIDIDAPLNNPNIYGFSPPVSTGLLAWHFFGADPSAPTDPAAAATRSKRNYAFGLPDATPVNLPTPATSYLGLGGGASISAAPSFDTGILDNLAETTLITVARSAANFVTNATRPQLVTSWSSLGGTGLYVTGPASGGAAPSATLNISEWRTVSGTPTTRSSTLTIANFSNFGFYAGVSAAGGRRLIAKTAGLDTGFVADANAKAPVGRNFVIGAGNGGGFYGSNDQAFAAIYNRALSVAEIDAIYAFIKGYLSRRSIEV